MSGKNAHPVSLLICEGLLRRRDGGRHSVPTSRRVRKGQARAPPAPPSPPRRLSLVIIGCGLSVLQVKKLMSRLGTTQTTLVRDCRMSSTSAFSAWLNGKLIHQSSTLRAGAKAMRWYEATKSIQPAPPQQAPLPCGRNSRCTRGFKHGGLGGHCKLADSSRSSKRADAKRVRHWPARTYTQGILP